ncbi:hypothetical protein [Streptomyces goshikiensis]|uniref:hypothetical protein n=1 Tax=Streptomyces goshikiensis TaxID=1942 RepID=UPI002E0D49C5|nr:hypothetical protein OG224_00780 [Streptomyces goshikiensis]WSS02873.1 hypothetical protein OG224_35035 [Streptomyces goshikiensis]
MAGFGSDAGRGSGTLGRPYLVAEINADRAIDQGCIFRRPLRFSGLRLVVTVEAVPPSARDRPLRLSEGYQGLLGGLCYASAELTM